MPVKVKEEYILYAYNIKQKKYVKCKKSVSLNEIKKFYDRVTRDDAKHKDLKCIPECTVLNDFYIQHNVFEYEVIKTLISEEIIMKEK